MTEPVLEIVALLRLAEPLVPRARRLAFTGSLAAGRCDATWVPSMSKRSTMSNAATEKEKIKRNANMRCSYVLSETMLRRNSKRQVNYDAVQQYQPCVMIALPHYLLTN